MLKRRQTGTGWRLRDVVNKRGLGPIFCLRMSSPTSCMFMKVRSSFFSIPILQMTGISSHDVRDQCLRDHDSTSAR